MMCEHVIDTVLNSYYCARAVEQPLSCCSRLRMTEFSHLFFLLKIMYRYNLVMEKESKTLLHSFAKPSSNNVLQPTLIRGSGCNTLSHSGLANVDTHKIIVLSSY